MVAASSTDHSAKDGEQRAHTEAPSQSPPIAAILESLDELRRHGEQYLILRRDRLSASIRRVVLHGLLIVVGAVMGASLVVTAVVLTLVGIADGLGQLLGPHAWAGNLLTGLVVLGSAAIALRALIRARLRSSFERTMKKYERRSA